MATYLTSNIFSDIYVGGNCVVKGTVTALGGSAVSQWTTAGSTIYYNTGNVGIGIASPFYKLHISGGDTSLALFGPNTTWSSYLAVGAAASAITSTTAQVICTNGNLHLDAAAAGAAGRSIYLNYYTSGSSSGGNGSSIVSWGPWTHTGSLGVGVNPAYPLHVAGDINFTGSLRQNGTLYTAASQWTGSGGSPIYYVPFVGIGSTLTPTASLMVTGNVYVSNAIQTTNIISAGFTSNATTTTFTSDTLAMPFVNATQVTVASSVGIGTTNPTAALDVYQSLNGQTGIRITNPNTGTAAVGGLALGTNDSENRGGMAVFSSTYIGAGGPRASGTYVYCNGAGGLTLAAEGANNVFFLTNYTERMRIVSSGNVGIGTTNPAYALDTVGDINASATLRIGGLIQPRLISSGTFTGVTTFDTVTFDLVNYNMVEIRMTMYFSTTNQKIMSSQLLDTGGTVYSSNEDGWQVYRSGQNATGTGANIMNNTEIVGNAVGGFYSVIRLTGNQGLSQSTRNHWDWTTVGCYAGLGASTTLGRAAVYNTSFVTMNRMRFNLSGGTMTGKYSIINYSS